MNIEKLTKDGRVATIVYLSQTETPYQVTIQEPNQPEQQSFALYEDALEWASQKLSIPTLTVNPERIVTQIVDKVGREESDFILHVRDAPEDQKLAVFALAADEAGIATIQGNGHMRYYNRQQAVWAGTVQVDPLDHFAIAPNGPLGVIVRKRMMEVWHLPTGTLQTKLPLPFAPRRLSVWPDKQILVLENQFDFNYPDEEFPFVQLWNLASGSWIGDIKIPPAQRDNSLDLATFSAQKDSVILYLTYEGPYSYRTRMYILFAKQLEQFQTRA